MSYSSGSGKSFGGKGVSQKKDRKRKLDFHRHKVKYVEEEHMDFEELKVRASVALDKLGHQKFSSEPSGYTFHNWMTSYNLLLDDFETRSKPASLPKWYYDERQRLTADLLKPVDTRELDDEIDKAESEIESLNLRISSLNETADREISRKKEESAPRISDLRRERVESQNELDGAVKELERNEKRRSVFGRLLAGNSSRERIKDKIGSLRERNQSIAAEIRALESGTAKKEVDNEIMNLRETLDELRDKLEELKSRKEEISQLEEKRANATSALSKLISSLTLNNLEEKISADQN